MERETERMRRMKENFMERHNDGLSIAQIAEEFNLGKASIYRVLQEIADANGVSRESLLKIVRKPTERAYKEETQRIKVNIDELRTGFKEVGEKLDFLINFVDETLKEEKRICE